MNKLIAVVLLAACVSGCASRTKYGPCVGLNDQENPQLVYKYSKRNIILGVVFLETIVAPVVVAFSELRCPSAVREIRK